MGQYQQHYLNKYISKSRSKRSDMMAKPNFNFVKRQKELEKKKKNEEKQQRKLANKSSGSAEEPEQPTDEEEAPN